MRKSNMRQSTSIIKGCVSANGMLAMRMQQQATGQ
jgi:hypothetical protein